MKTTNIYIIVLTLLLSVSVQAQTTSTSSGNEAYKGIENTLLDFKDDVIETVSDVKDKADDILDDIKDGIEKIAYLEKFMRGDIRLLMLSIEENSKFNYSGIKIFTENGFDLYTRNEDNTSSLYIEFDWDNRAQKMVGKGDAFDSHIGFLSTDAGGDIGKFTNKAHSSVQFTDKESYWYVPLKAESGNTMFIKFNAKQMAVESLKTLQDLAIDLKASDFAKILMGLMSKLDFQNLLSSIPPENYLAAIFSELGQIDYAEMNNLGDEKISEIEEKIKELIEQLLSQQLKEIGGFPIFIHWAFIYSPEVIKKHYGNKASETTFDCDGFSNACTKLTITSYPFTFCSIQIKIHTYLANSSYRGKN